MEMKSKDLTVRRQTEKELFISCEFGLFGMSWPLTVRYQRAEYAFACNEPIPAEFAADYGGYAKYLLVRDL